MLQSLENDKQGYTRESVCVCLWRHFCAEHRRAGWRPPGAVFAEELKRMIIFTVSESVDLFDQFIDSSFSCPQPQDVQFIVKEERRK